LLGCVRAFDLQVLIGRQPCLRSRRANFEPATIGIQGCRSRAAQPANRADPRLLCQTRPSSQCRVPHPRRQPSWRSAWKKGTIESLPREYRSFAHEALSVSWTPATVTSPAASDISTSRELTRFSGSQRNDNRPCFARGNRQTYLRENSVAQGGWRSASILNARPIMLAPIMQRVPATILLGRGNSGERIPWRFPTAFAPT
jgi:hypothetical protein